MRWPLSLSVCLLAASTVIGARLPDRARGELPSQAVLGVPSVHTLAWDEPLDEDAMGNHIFNSLYSLMQMLPNSRYSNGHSIVRASIAPGTLLYHGSPNASLPTSDWLAFDPEHALLFAEPDDGVLFTFAASRTLHLVYFDGASANKVGGVIDTQNLLIYGRVEHQDKSSGLKREAERLADACKWGEQYGVDGFVRMEFDFELMYCDFSKGLELVSGVETVPSIINGPAWSRRPSFLANASFEKTTCPQSDAELPWEPQPPVGWIGCLAGNEFPESGHSGAWHNDFPGDLRVRVDPATMITFFDPAYMSLIPLRRGRPRVEHRLLGISQADIERAQTDIAEMMVRGRRAGEESASGVDWVALTQAVMQRFADRLPLLRHLLYQPMSDISAKATKVRSHLSVSLLPYIPRRDVGTPVWFARIAEGCASGFTQYLYWPAMDARLTKQERVLRCAVDEVLHEVCRVLGKVWEEAFDVEEQSLSVMEESMARWRKNIDGLIKWLDWPVWNVCDPGCAVDEICWLPQQGPRGRAEDQEQTPRCVKLTEPFKYDRLQQSV